MRNSRRRTKIKQEMGKEKKVENTLFFTLPPRPAPPLSLSTLSPKLHKVQKTNGLVQVKTL